jgi:hypothetical protein
MSDHEFAARDLFTIAKFYTPTDAHIVRGCLQAAGIPAVVVDDYLVQFYSLWTIALGGVRILVPEVHLQSAQEIMDAFNRGDLQLPDDMDVEGI